MTEFWTMITGVGTLLLAVVASRGLRSLRLAKADMKNRATRDTKASAITRCEEFAAEIIPANAPLATMAAIAAKAGAASVVETPDDIVFDPDDEKQLVAAREWRGKLPSDAVRDTIRLLNRLEAWAVYFTTGVADHETAFGPCAPVYCSLITQHCAVLLTLRADSVSGKFPNAVQLFKSWRDLLNEQKRGLKEEDLRRQLRDLQQRAIKQNVLPPPLGTKLDA